MSFSEKNSGESYLKELARIIYDNSADIVLRLIAEQFPEGTVGHYLVTTNSVDSLTNLIFAPGAGRARALLLRSPPTGLNPDLVTLLTNNLLDIEPAIVPTPTDELSIEFAYGLRDIYLRLYREFNNQPYGPCSGLKIFYPSKNPNKRYIIASVANGTVIIDGDKFSKINGPISYKEAVKKEIVISFLPSTWNLWHEYAQVGDYIYHMQEAFVVSNGLQIIDITNICEPKIIRGKNINERDLGVFSGFLFQGAHFITSENDRPIVWVNGVTTFQAYLPENDILIRSTFMSEQVKDDSNNRLEPIPLVTEVKSVKQRKLPKNLKAHSKLAFIAEEENFDEQLRHEAVPLNPRIVLGLDVSDPANPVIIAKWRRAYAHDIQILKRSGKYYAFMVDVFNESIYIVNVTDPSEIDETGFYSMWTNPPLQILHLVNTTATAEKNPILGNANEDAQINFPHSIYFSPCGNFAYVFNENRDAPVYVLDISNFHRIRIINRFLLPRWGTTIHEAKLEFCPELELLRLWVSAYEAGVMVFDLYLNPSNLKLIGWNEASIRTSPDGDIPTLSGGFDRSGFWSFQPLAKKNLGAGSSIGSRFTCQVEREGRGVSEDSATVLLQLVDPYSCDLKHINFKVNRSPCLYPLKVPNPTIPYRCENIIVSEPSIKVSDNKWTKCLETDPMAFVSNGYLLDYNSRVIRDLIKDC